MILFDFDYERADTLEDAVALLARLQGEARALAGGTDLLPSMRMENIRPGLLVSLSGIEPGEPEVLADGSIRIDALSRLASLENSSLLRSRVPMLAQSAHAVGGNQIRQMGTLGGNLCQEVRCLYLDQKHDYQFVAPCYKRGGECCYPFPRNGRDTCWSVYMSDIAPALIALDAQVEILGESGSRRIRVEELYTGNGLAPLKLGHAELLRAVFIPPAPRGFGWGFHKSTVRGGLEFGMAVIARGAAARGGRKDLRRCPHCHRRGARGTGAGSARRALAQRRGARRGAAGAGGRRGEQGDQPAAASRFHQAPPDGQHPGVSAANPGAGARASAQSGNRQRNCGLRETHGKRTVMLDVTKGTKSGAAAKTRSRTRLISLCVNGEWHEVAVKPRNMLVEVIRDTIGLTGTKASCESGTCGACTVLVEGKPVLGCITLAVECDGKQVRTVEGLADGEKLSAIQEAFLDQGAVQCGFCTPGMLMSATALLERNPKPTRAGHQQGARRQSVPLHRLQQHRRCRAAGLRAGREAGDGIRRLIQPLRVY